jgi:hypothetical protein
VAVLLLLGYGIGRASDRTDDEAVLTVQVTAADHEVVEGYFSLGEQATLMVKPGTDVHRFLSRSRGQKITITMTQGASRTLSRLDRDR